MTTHCPSCGAKIKSNSFNNNELLTEQQNKIIAIILQKEYAELCHKCGLNDYYKAQSGISVKIEELQSELNKIVSLIPIITIHTPVGWNYDIIGMVTAQSATGTGALTEFVSSFTDIIGAQSERHKLKLKSGENMCKTQLQMQTVEMGGNAIIGVDIDYSEIGSGKGILMVCMAGTAIKRYDILNNMDILNEAKFIKDKLTEIYLLSNI